METLFSSISSTQWGPNFLKSLIWLFFGCATKKHSAEKHSAEKHTAHKHSAEKHTAKKQLEK